MSASVWFEEVNTGLIKELRETVKIKNAEGILTPLPDEVFTVRRPEKEDHYENYPCVSIWNLDYKYQVQRHLPLQYYHRMSETKTTLEVEELAVPFDLYYQVDFWAGYQSDMDTMTRLWLMRHHRQFNLPVVDDGGTPRTVNVMQDGDIVRLELENGIRRFRTSIKYVIWVEIDDETRYTVPKVATIDVDLHQKT